MPSSRRSGPGRRRAIAFWVWSRESGRRWPALGGATGLSAPLWLAHGCACIIFGLMIFACEIGRCAELRRLLWKHVL